jgi:hypothetical protein
VKLPPKGGPMGLGKFASTKVRNLARLGPARLLVAKNSLEAGAFSSLAQAPVTELSPVGVW